MKQYQKDIIDSFKGVFTALTLIAVLISGVITLAAGPSAGTVFVLSLFVPILVTAIAVSVITGVRVNN